MKHEPLPIGGRPLLAALALAALAVLQPAHGECLSPSTPAGATATTVYRCPDVDPSANKQPALGNTEKSTVVERGSPDVPWFEPQATGNKVDADKMPAARAETASTPDAKIESLKAPDEKIKIVKTPDKKIKAVTAPEKNIEAVKAPEKIEAASAPEPEEIVKVKKKAPGKKKLAGKKRAKKTKIAKARTTKIKAANVKTAEETPKIESKPPDEKTIVWTKKDMPLGSRIKTWLGF